MSKLLFIVDGYHWALANRANNLKNYYKNHKIDIIHFNEIKKVNFDNYNIIYSLNWPIHNFIKNKISSKKKYSLITTISSHVGRGHASTLSGILKNYDKISTSNKFLYNEFKSSFGNKIFYTPFGVNSSLFLPKTKPSLYYNIFGWVGNHKRDVKRFNIIEKTFKRLGPKYILKTVFQDGNLSRSQMSDFYNSVGTVICFSSSEGTPNPILEAAACGRSIISTPVGNVPELTKGNKNIFIVNNYNQLKSAIINTVNNKEQIDLNGKFLRNEVELYWSWKKRAKGFSPFLGIK